MTLIKLNESLNLNKPLFHKVKQPFHMSMINSPQIGNSCTSLNERVRGGRDWI